MRVWFNHWFSTAYRIMELLKQGDSNITIISSNKLKLAVYQKISSEFYLEPMNISDNDYVLWCLDFCKKHNIDVFIPRRGRLEISKNLQLFLDNNIKVMVHTDSSLVECLEDKFETAKIFKENNLCNVSDLYLVDNVEDFKRAYKELDAKNEKVCVKYNKDEGGLSFHIIEKELKYHTLRTNIGVKLSYDTIISILSEKDNFEDMLVMPYLEGPEISIDSLNTKKGFIGLTREKLGTRATQVKFDKELYEISKKFAEITNITMPYNLQMRWHNSQIYLLEVNTRMAGGTYKSCLTGVNIPYIAYCELMGLDYEIPDIQNIKEILVSEIEAPIILNNF